LALSPQDRLGPYEIVGPLGAGGMGEVWKAKDTRLDRFVAVKVLPAQLAKDGEALARFGREAKAVAALNHPNILALRHQTRTASCAPRELLAASPARAWRLGRPARKAIEIAVQIARGGCRPRGEGVVRDPEPDNLWACAGRQAQDRLRPAKRDLPGGAGDALAAQTEGFTGGDPGSTARGTILGTIGYMSPEQVRGESVDARSDLFSFGAVLFEMLTGTRAFARNSATETLAAILRDDPPAPDTTSRPIPAGLERIIHHCLEKSPDQRFRSAHDVAFALENLSGGSDSAAAFTAPFEPQKRKTSWKGAALALLLVLGGSVAGWVVGRGRTGGATAGGDAVRPRSSRRTA
jgi:serine/threonine protein kinase